jgi:cytochrome c peroxidase
MRTALLLVCVATVSCGTKAEAPPAAALDAGALRVPELGPVPALPDFADGPVTAAQIALGTTLYFDVRLSGSGHTSCAACHIPGTTFQDGLPLSTPDRSYPGDSPTLTRNTLSLLNVVYAPVLRWEGSQTDLTTAMAFPLAEPNMNLGKLPAASTVVDVPGTATALAARFGSDLRGYAPLFQSAFSVDLASLTHTQVFAVTGKALRAFVTQAVSRDAPFDRWNAGDDSAMSASAVRGLSVFRGSGRCIDCHSGPLFTDFGFHNVSSSPPGPDGTRPDEGHFEVTGNPADHGAFLTPTLRQAYDTGPYFHDGSKLAIAQVLEFFASSDSAADPDHDPVFDTPLPLSNQDIEDLVAFVQALRGTPGATITPPSAFP